jgi:hypothetical protein
MYLNGKMRPVGTIPGMGGGEKAMIYCKTFCKGHNIPLF